jgi:hypothetical protein
MGRRVDPLAVADGHGVLGEAGGGGDILVDHENQLDGSDGSPRKTVTDKNQ